MDSSTARRVFEAMTNENCFARAFGGAGGTVNAGWEPPRTPTLLGTSGATPPFFVFFKKRFLANKRENIFGEWPLRL